jgi:hypothetical protein
MQKITVREILNINDPENFYVKLDKIDQFGIDTKSLYINDKEKLLQEMAFHHDTNRPTENATYNYVMDRAYTLHFIPYDEKNKLWLYVGAYYQTGKYEVKYGDHTTTYYKLQLEEQYSRLKGRLIVHFDRKPGTRQVRAGLETDFADRLTLHSILEQEISNVKFRDYQNIHLTYPQLKNIITHNDQKWFTALSTINAIYLQTDKKTGKQYVGSAYGREKLWGRWKQYVETYHGGNKSLKELYEKEGPKYFEKNFTYSLLEVIPNSRKDMSNLVIERESWWKIVLQSREFGYNNN